MGTESTSTSDGNSFARQERSPLQAQIETPSNGSWEGPKDQGRSGGSTSYCRHVRVKATRQELWDIGICSERTFEMLLSGCAFEVIEVRENKGRKMIYLGSPFGEGAMVWVWETMTENVHK